MQQFLDVAPAVLCVFLPALGLTAFLLADAHRRGRGRIPAVVAGAATWSARPAAWFPALSAVAFVLLCAVAWIRNGALPTTTHIVGFSAEGLEWAGGPNSSLYDPAPWILLIAIGCSLLSILVVPGLFAVVRAVGAPVGARSRAAFYSSWAVLLAVLLTDPLGLVGWVFGG